MYELEQLAADTVKKRKETGMSQSRITLICQEHVNAKQEMMIDFLLIIKTRRESHLQTIALDKCNGLNITD